MQSGLPLTTKSRPRRSVALQTQPPRPPAPRNWSLRIPGSRIFEFEIIAGSAYIDLMEQLLNKLSDVFYTAALTGSRFWIVGGTVRDHLMGCEPVDYDIAVDGNPADFADLFSRTYGGRPVALGRGDFQVFRVAALGRFFDFSRIEGDNIEEDLRRRDFTINAMAVSPPGGRIIDPLDGLQDLYRRRIRMAASDVFERDPVRLVRAFRMAARYGLDLDPETEERIRIQASLLTQSAGERIRDELLKILEADRSSPVVIRMNEDGVLTELLPELSALAGCRQNGYHQHDVLSHTLLVLSHLEAVLADPAAWLPMGGSQARQADVCRNPVMMKLAVLLHDIGKPAARGTKNGRTHFRGHSAAGFQMTEAVFERLRLSNRQRRFVGFLVRHHIRPLQLFLAHQRSDLTSRGRTRFFARCGPMTPALLLLATADMAGKRTPLDERFAEFARFADSLLEAYFRDFRPISDAPALITGKDLITLLGLPPSPLFKRVLDTVEIERLEGRLENRQQALDRARELARAWR